MTTNPIALAKLGEWTSICGDPPELLVRELADLGFVIVPRDDAPDGVPATLTPSSPEEIQAWETWAKDGRFNMDEHPLHYLFLDRETAAARKGWKAGLEFARLAVRGREERT